MFGLTLDQLLVAILVAMVLPAIVAAATAWNAPSSLKTMVLLILSVIATALQAVLWQDHVSWKEFLAALAGQVALAVLAHFGIVKPVGLSGPSSSVARSGLQIGGPK